MDEGILIVLLILGIGVIYYLLRLFRAYKRERRLAVFAIESKKQKTDSILDKLSYYFTKVIKCLSNILNSSVLLKRYGEKYNKYISYEERKEKDGIDYVSLKFIISFGIIILYLISLFIKQIKIDFMLILIILIISFFLPDILLSIDFNKKNKKLEDDLLKAIIIMNNAFNSGRNIMQAAESVKNELDGPISDEFKKIYLDITYGLELDVVFSRFYERVRLDDVKYITTSLSLLNKTGGDIVKVFSMLEKSILDKKRLKNELHSLTSASRFVFKLLVFLPILFVLLIFILNPSYFTPLFTSAIGIVILVFICLLYVLYIYVVKKVLEVKL